MKVLTTREQQVLRLAALTNKDIADVMNIKENTVKTFVQRICAKLNVNTKVQAVIKVLRLGLMQPHQFYIGKRNEE